MREKITGSSNDCYSEKNDGGAVKYDLYVRIKAAEKEEAWR